MSPDTVRGWLYGIATGVLCAWFTWAVLDRLAS